MVSPDSDWLFTDDMAANLVSVVGSSVPAESPWQIKNFDFGGVEILENGVIRCGARVRGWREPVWLKRVYDEGADECSTKVLAQLIGELKNILRKGEYTKLDDVFSNLELERLAPEVNIAFLRVSATARGKLKNWNSLLQNVRNEFVRRGFDPSKELIGLLP